MYIYIYIYTWGFPMPCLMTPEGTTFISCRDALLPVSRPEVGSSKNWARGGSDWSKSHVPRVLERHFKEWIYGSISSRMDISKNGYPKSQKHIQAYSSNTINAIPCPNHIEDPNEWNFMDDIPPWGSFS